jgi:hypothetical protein
MSRLGVSLARACAHKSRVAFAPTSRRAGTDANDPMQTSDCSVCGPKKNMRAVMLLGGSIIKARLSELEVPEETSGDNYAWAD